MQTYLSVSELQIVYRLKKTQPCKPSNSNNPQGIEDVAYIAFKGELLVFTLSYLNWLQHP